MYHAYLGSYRSEPLGLSVTREQAIAEASAVAAQIDDGLSLCHVMTVGLPVSAGEENTWEHPWAWQCVFMRQVNGMGSVYDSRDVGSDMESNVRGRTNEKLEITVDERGVCNIHWINPMTVSEITNPNVTLLPFDTITEKLADQLRAKYDYDISRKDGAQELFIQHAELGLMRVGKPGSTAFVLEPVWSFFVDFQEQRDYPDYELQRAAYDGDPRFWNSLTVSAVDGRILDRDRGE